MQVETLTAANEQAYEEMLRQEEHTLLYASLKYRNLLRRYLGAEEYYLIAKQTDKIVGVLPLILKRNSTYGNVLNSLPFYGSNGGVIVASTVPDPEPIFKALLNAFHSLARETETVVATIITSPFDRYAQLYEKYLPIKFRDSRIGQISYLPPPGSNFEEVIMNRIHRSKPGDIRKARKKGLSVTHADTLETLRFLVDTHQENIRAVGGIAKEWGFFKQVAEIFDYGTDYRIFVAELEGQPVGALLLFYYNNTVEYFTPATVQKYRSLQPGSLLIFAGMKDAAQRGYRYWNFGGTWHSQEGVYQFKKRWAAQDVPYHYYITDCQNIEHLLEMTPQQILVEYPHFYVLPFTLLKH